MVLCCFFRFPAVWAVPGRQTRAGGGEKGSPQIPSIPADLGQHQIPKKPSQKIQELCQSCCFPSIQSCQLLGSFSDVFRLCLRTIIEGTRRWGQEFLIPTGSFCPKTPLFTPNGFKSLIFSPPIPFFPLFPPVPAPSSSWCRRSGTSPTISCIRSRPSPSRTCPRRTERYRPRNSTFPPKNEFPADPPTSWQSPAEIWGEIPLFPHPAAISCCSFPGDKGFGIGIPELPTPLQAHFGFEFPYLMILYSSGADLMLLQKIQLSPGDFGEHFGGLRKTWWDWGSLGLI